MPTVPSLLKTISDRNGVVWCQDMPTFRSKCKLECPSLGKVTCLLAMTAGGSRAAGAGIGLSVTQSLSLRTCPEDSLW